jgi:phosphotransferase system HPr (HPr) family protein
VPTSSEVERVVNLPAGIDLHARPAAQLVRTAVGFAAEIGVAVNGREANAKSLLAVLALGATAGTPLRLTASGQDAAVALNALGECVAAFE